MNVYRVYFGRKLLDYGVIQHQTLDFATWSMADKYIKFCNNHVKTPYISPFGKMPMIFDYAYIEAYVID